MKSKKGENHERKMNFEETSREETLENIKVIDGLRKNYYTRFTGRQWGDKKNYNLCLDSSSLGIDECVSYVIKYIEENIIKNSQTVSDSAEVE